MANERGRYQKGFREVGNSKEFYGKDNGARKKLRQQTEIYELLRIYSEELEESI